MLDRIIVTPARDLQPESAVSGGGLTRQLAIFPDEADASDFTWRVSTTEWSTPGPLATWEGIDRILLLTEGGPLHLVSTETGQEKVLEPAARLYFAGETPYTAQLPAGPVQGFNLMFARKVAHGCVDVRRTAQALPLRPGDTVLHCTKGQFHLDFPERMGGPCTLAAGDTLHLTLDYIPFFRLDIRPEAPNSCLIDARLNLYPNVGT